MRKNLFTNTVRTRGRGWALALLAWLALASNVSAQTQRPQLRLDLRGDGANTIPAFIYFQEGATTGFDSDIDATSPPNSSGLNLLSYNAASEYFSINGLPISALSAPYTVNLYVGVPAYGTYTLQVGQLANFASTQVYLIDALLNTTTPLALDTTYPIELTDANTNGTYVTRDRFTLSFQPDPTPLPVVLTSFVVTAQPAGVHVSWSTASEMRSAYFAVERSADGQQFEEIGRRAAAGSSAQAHTYELLDVQPLAGTTYYRLHQVDTDGSIAYSLVRTVAGPTTSLVVEAFPTRLLSGQTLGLRVRTATAGPATLLVTDALGRAIVQQALDLPVGATAISLPATSQWPKGLYLLRVQQGSQQHTGKIVRE
jgi:hypothetical protein